ncbi:hypothetical protein PJI16_19485 [Nitrospira sp. MA-1]|nr:hypothetical protein [Nitrospira sp. MA-1]
MQIYRMRLPRAALQQLPEAERAFFLLAGHMQNELNSLHKVFAWCLQNQAKTPIESLVNGVQAQLYARLLAGKLLEAWNALNTSFFGTKISQRIEASLHPSAQEALVSLKAYFRKSNLIHRVRNSFAFHYAAEEFEHHWLEVSDDPNFEVVLGGTVGNNMTLASELVVNTAVLNSANQGDQSAALQKFLEEVQLTANHFTNFLEGVTLVFLTSVYPSPIRAQGSIEVIDPPFQFEGIAIPHFYDHGLSDD